MHEEQNQTALRQHIIEILVSAVKFRNQNDVDGMMRHVADDAVYVGDGWKNFRNREVRGRDALAQMAWMVFIEYESLGIVVREVLFDGDQVAILRTATLRRRGSGKTMDVDIWCFARFANGKIAEVREHFDTLQMDLLDD